MNHLNSLILEGTIVKECEVAKLPNGMPVSKLQVSVLRQYKNNVGEWVDEMSYFDVEAYGNNYLNYIQRYGEVGAEIRIVGRIKQTRWADDTGKQHSKVCVVAEHIEFKPDYKEKKNESSSNF